MSSWPHQPLPQVSCPSSWVPAWPSVAQPSTAWSKDGSSLPPLNLAHSVSCPSSLFPFSFILLPSPLALPLRNGFHLIQVCLATDFFCPAQESRACWGLVEQYIKIWSLFLLIWCSALTAQLELSTFGISWQDWRGDTPLLKALHSDEWKWAAVLCPASRQPNKNINS